MFDCVLKVKQFKLSLTNREESWRSSVIVYVSKHYILSDESTKHKGNEFIKNSWLSRRLRASWLWLFTIWRLTDFLTFNAWWQSAKLTRSLTSGSDVVLVSALYETGELSELVSQQAIEKHSFAIHTSTPTFNLPDFFMPQNHRKYRNSSDYLEHIFWLINRSRSCACASAFQTQSLRICLE